MRKTVTMSFNGNKLAANNHSDRRFIFMKIFRRERVGLSCPEAKCQSKPNFMWSQKGSQNYTNDMTKMPPCPHMEKTLHGDSGTRGLQHLYKW